jgi:site-specific DNA recombinase
MRAVLYLRVSTLYQKELQSGLKAQLRACREKAAELRIKEVYVFKDSGVSGFTEIQERVGLSNALIMLQPFDFFIVVSRDRIARDTAIAAQVERIVEDKGATLISIAGEGTAIPGVQGLQERRMADIKSEILRKLIIENTKESLRLKKQKGERIGTVPYGLKLARDGIGLELCHEELLIIKLVNSLKFKGASLRDITEEINVQGYRGRTGRPFQLNQVVNMLENNNQFIVLEQPYSKVRFLPYGYKLKKDSSEMEKCVKEQKVIALVKQLHRQAYSPQAITTELNNRGYRSRVGTLFQYSQIFRIVRREVERAKNTDNIQRGLKYGFKVSNDGATVIECSEEQKVVCQAKLLKSRGFSFRAITKKLNSDGFLSRVGKPFQLTQIVRMLRAQKLKLKG